MVTGQEILVAKVSVQSALSNFPETFSCPNGKRVVPHPTGRANSQGSPPPPPAMATKTTQRA
jgi:hypothetical protein